MDLIVRDFFAVVGLLVAMVLIMEMAWRKGHAARVRDPDGFAQGVGAFEGAVYGLLGLLVAFTFSGAASRFEDRRHLITEETNAIGTAYLRIALLPVNTQPEMRELFRRYVDSRIASTGHPENKQTADEESANEQLMQNTIWSKAVEASVRPDAVPDAMKLLLPSLNDMIDITTTRLAARQNHPPTIIFFMLYGICLASSWLAGYGMAAGKERNWLHRLLFAGVISLAVYVIMDLEFPRQGLIKVNGADQILIDLRNSMN